jgi:hydrogenase maturation protein HypF
MKRERQRLLIKGVVQGVGFRPFVYRAAVERGLFGSVCNRGDAGVEIFIEGEPTAVSEFANALRHTPPPLARIDTIEIETCVPIGETQFVIATSRSAGHGRGFLPPDTAICERCVADVLGASRYRGYWATSCTDCGPRFTVIEGLPYDRPRTSMREFPMCEACAREYLAPHDRRYHAQTIGCEVCGPALTFDGSNEAPIERTIDALSAGAIVAIKGIGGTHLACDATNVHAVEAIRRRLGRSTQPFALMATEQMIAGMAFVNEEEWTLLRAAQRPIVVIRQRPGKLPEAINPGLDAVGVMLPYTGLHHLLFERFDSPVVMTSANLSGLPMWIEDKEIRDRARGVADHVLLHNRRIVARCDDSVLRRSGGASVFLRRSRGYVPDPFAVDLGEEAILALGPETGLTFSLYEDGALTTSQHIGSVDNLETYAFLRAAIDHLRGLLRFSVPRVIAHDLHPRFLTTRLAVELKHECAARLVAVQHHAAHLLSVMGEHDIDSAVGVILDGYGYGLDGTAWGGEILVAVEGEVERAGSLSPVRLPGGDLATRFPLRLAAAFLLAGGQSRDIVGRALVARGLSEREVDLVLSQTERGLNAPWTTSAGRFLDAISAWLGVCEERTYEGEPAMRLEAAARGGRPIELTAPIRTVDGRRELDTVNAFLSLAELAKSRSVADVAATAQVLLADGVTRIAADVAREKRINVVAFSGGVAYNDAIAERVREQTENAGLTYATNTRVPCGDGGVSFGQAVYAGRRWSASEANRPDAASREDAEHREHQQQPR